MEKIFTPNRWFIGFCALLIVVVGALKIVGDMHLAEEAKLVAMGIFNFDWPELGIESRVQSINAHVISHNEHDAVVEVSGRQYIAKLTHQPVAPPATTPATGAETTPATPPPASATKLVAAGPPENAEFKAILTFYRANNIWELGKVEQVN
jgi:hypothetical protein